MAKAPKSIHAIKHDDATRKNIPTAEMESFFLREEDSAPRPPVAYPVFQHPLHPEFSLDYIRDVVLQRGRQ